ncbi:hypothetical protein [Aliikangiella sp. IMCC44359]|uniref:hypothetical protein n=1 Tax=Aliikangiella sp. IMCC44359 TaxID=3459125 RepID=UPI00403A8F69
MSNKYNSKIGIGMNYTAGSLVRRKVGGVVGVLMASEPDEQTNKGYMLEIAFGYLTKFDAQINKSFSTQWAIVHCSHIEIIGSQ